MTADELGAFWEALHEAAERHGAAPMNKHPGCWELDMGEWKLAANGHREPTTHSLSDVPLAPFTIYVTFNGWPAGLIDAGGAAVAAGSVANLATLTAALRASQPPPARGGRE